MQNEVSDDLSKPIFSARLRPYRSLKRGGLIALMAISGIGTIFSIVLFVLLGAWPVSACCGLDLLALCLAFRLSYRSARAYEEITVSCCELAIRRVSVKGREERYSFNPFWARLLTSSLQDEGMVELAITSHGRTLVIGQFLSPVERESFAGALKRALGSVRENRVVAELAAS